MVSPSRIVASHFKLVRMTDGHCGVGCAVVQGPFLFLFHFCLHSRSSDSQHITIYMDLPSHTLCPLHRYISHGQSPSSLLSNWLYSLNWDKCTCLATGLSIHRTSGIMVHTLKSLLKVHTIEVQNHHLPRAITSNQISTIPL